MTGPRVGIMQPYFFPHLGYFSLIQNTDEWIVFDVTQYTPKTWMNRNRVLHPRQGWNWVTVPLAAASRSIPIHEARLADSSSAHESVLGKLSHYRRRAPHWRSVERLVDETFADPGDPSLVGLDVRALRATCDYLEIPFHYHICSTMDFSLAGIDHPGGWAPAIASALGAATYVNPMGGRHLFDVHEFESYGLGLEFLEQPIFEYPVGPYTYEPQLSILDVLMWNDTATVRDAMSTARTLPAAEVLAA